MSKIVVKCPYPGDEPFSENEGGFFFGRQNEIQAIIDRLTTWRLTILYGDSGVGKSSVLRAGVSYEIRSRAEENKKLYNNFGWSILVCRPLNKETSERKEKNIFSWENPLRGLKQSLAEVNYVQAESFETISLYKCINECLEGIKDSNKENRLFIILDQIEYYLLRDRKPEDDQFDRELAQAIEDKNLNVSFLIAIREDALSKLDHFKYLIPSIFDNRFELKNLSKSSAIEAIEEPINKFNQCIKSDGIECKLEMGLRDKILKGLADLEGKPSEETNIDEKLYSSYILQLVMHRLWKEEEKESWKPNGTIRIIKNITFDNILPSPDIKYPKNISTDEGKTVYRIVQDHVYGKLNTLEDKQKDIAASIFHYMVMSSGYSIPQDAEDLTQHANEYLDLLGYHDKFDTGQIRDLLNMLSDQKFRILNSHSQGRFEAYHRSLSLQLLEWSNRRLVNVQIANKLSQKSFKQFELKNYRYSLLLALEALKIQKDGKKPNPLAIMAMLQAQWMFPNYRIADEQPTDNQQEVILSAFSSDKKWLVTAGKEGDVDRYDLAYRPFPDYKQDIGNKFNIGKMAENITTMAITNDGQWIACSYQNGIVQLMELNSGRVIPRSIREPNIGKVTALAIRNHPPCLISGHENGEVLCWKLNNDIIISSEIIKHGGSVHLLAMSSEESWLVSAGTDEYTYLYRWNSDNYTQVTKSPLIESPTDSVTAVTFSKKFQSENQWLCVGQKDGGVYVYQVGGSPDNPKKWLIRDDIYLFSSRIRCIEINSDRRWLATGGDDELVRVWDLANLAIPPLVLRGHESPISSLSFDSLKKNTLVTAAINGSLFIWDLANPTFPVESADKVESAFVYEHPKLEDGILAVAFGKAEHSKHDAFNIAKLGLAILTKKNSLQFIYLDWINQGTIVLNPNEWGIHQLAVSTKCLVMDTFKMGNIVSYDINEFGKDGQIQTVIQRKDAIEQANAKVLVLSPDENWLFSGYNLKKPNYILWSVLRKERIQLINLEQMDNLIIYSAAFSPHDHSLDYPILAIAGELNDNGFVLFCHLKDTILEYSELRLVDDVVRCLAFVENGNNEYFLVTGGDDDKLTLWNLDGTQKNGKPLKPYSRAIHTLAVTQRLNKEVKTMETWLAAGGSDGTVCLYKDPANIKKENAKPTRLLTGHVSGDDVHFKLMVFSPNGKWLFSCNHRGDEPSACLWSLDVDDLDSKDAKPPIQPIRLRGHKSYLRAAAFSQNDEWLATAGADGDGRVHLWNLSALGLDPSAPPIVIRPYPIYHGLSTDKKNPDFLPKYEEVWAVAFCKDRLVTAGNDGTARLWDLSYNTLKEKENVVGRNMTFEEWRESFGDKEYERTCQQLPVHVSVIRDKFSRAKKFIRDSDKEEDKDKDKHKEAENLYRQVIEWVSDTTDVDLICAIGRWGCVNGFHKIALELCEKAVELKPDRVGCQDNKILALAMNGEYPIAAKYMEDKISSMDDEGIMSDQVHFGKRSTWLEQLNNDKNPFTLVNLMKLGEQDMDKISYSHLSLNKEYYFWDKSNNNA